MEWACHHNLFFSPVTWLSLTITAVSWGFQWHDCHSPKLRCLGGFSNMTVTHHNCGVLGVSVTWLSLTKTAVSWVFSSNMTVTHHNCSVFFFFSNITLSLTTTVVSWGFSAVPFPGWSEHGSADLSSLPAVTTATTAATMLDTSSAATASSSSSFLLRHQWFNANDTYYVGRTYPSHSLTCPWETQWSAEFSDKTVTQLETSTKMRIKKKEEKKKIKRSKQTF